MIRSRKILRQARGQACTLRLPGTCNGNPETTVWAHLNGHGKGMGLKTHDVLGMFACSSCHAAYDQGAKRGDLVEAVLSAVCESLVVLIRDGLIIVPQDAETPSHQRPVPKRKPPEQRTKIHGSTQIPSRPMKAAHAPNTRQLHEE